MAAPDVICQSDSGTITTQACHLSPAAPGSDYNDWERLINFRPPDAVKSSLISRFHTGIASSAVVYHQIENGYGQINLDYYVVRIDDMPTFDGDVMTKTSLLKHIRTFIGDFMDNSKSGANVFLKPYEQQDVTQWMSNAPLGTVMHFGIGGANWEGLPDNPENLSVVAAEIADDHWIFSTIWTPKDLGHPVSGNREFGIRTRSPADTFPPSYGCMFDCPVSTDTLYFYTRGADRCTTLGDSTLSATVFDGGDKCWQGLQDKVQSFISTHGGASEMQRGVSHVSERHDWDAIRQAHWKSPSP
jgi:hypothetical protein